MIKIYTFSVLIVSLFFTACTLHPRPGKQDFEKTFPPPYGSTNLNIKHHGFYFNNTLNQEDPQLFTYLSFKKNGTLIYFGSTGMTPDTLAVWADIWNPELKKSGFPKDKHVDFGFYKTKGDSVFAKIHIAGILGAWDYYDLKGKAFGDSLLLSFFKTGTGQSKETWSYKNLKFMYRPCE